MAYWPAKSLNILENRLKEQGMETEGYWPITRSSVKGELEGLLLQTQETKRRLMTTQSNLVRTQKRLEELINGMESGT